MKKQKAFAYEVDDQDGFPVHRLQSVWSPQRIEVLQMPGDEPGLTRQEMADECDINLIMKRYEKTGMIPTNGTQPMYLDWNMAPADLMDAMRQLHDADDAFMRLPASVRKEFDNDPMRFVEYAADPANVGRMREWGLAAPEVVPDPPALVQIVNPPAPDSGTGKPAKGD